MSPRLFVPRLVTPTVVKGPKVVPNGIKVLRKESLLLFVGHQRKVLEQMVGVVIHHQKVDIGDSVPTTTSENFDGVLVLGKEKDSVRSCGFHYGVRESVR